MNKDNSTAGDGEDIPCDVTMKIALIGDSGISVASVDCDL